MHIRQLIKNKRFEVIKALAESKKIKQEWLEDLYSILLKQDTDVEITQAKYEIIKLLLTEKKYLNFELLTKTLNLDQQTAIEIMRNPFKEVYFPTYNIENPEESRLNKALIIPLSNQTFTLNTFVNSQELETIKEATNKNFFVIFDNIFSGKSYQLAVAAGLIAKDKEILDNVAFTGEVSSNGFIIPVNHLEEKKEITEKAKKVLITPEDIENLEELSFWLNPEHLPVIFIHINKPDLASQSLKQMEDAIKKDERFKYFKLENLKKFYKLEDQDMYLITPSVDFSNREELIKILNEFREKVSKLLTLEGVIKDHNKVILNISAGISTLALYFGVILGNRQASIIYHYQKEYHKVIDLTDNPRKIKEKKSEFEKISVNKNIQDPLMIIIYLASHNPIEKGLELKEKLGAKGELIIQSKEHQGNLEIGDWSDIVSEIYTAIDDNKQKENYMVFSAPVAIMLALGMALGYFLPIKVFHYNRDEYVEVPIKLNEEILRSPF
ncbi:SAVED domain-containing protein [Sulfurihydrogenibium sp.]|jgi:hypothetical protein|uniref:SAVED domain-containing protein n=1 Tax=Sulfurihydrogenibium sp. TaxID=2053621 RepID=UPI00260B5D7B|nr:SAVED domain-containing protein [Sulfurihydrogenibium sp.]